MDLDERVANLETEVERLHATIDCLHEDITRAFHYIDELEIMMRDMYTGVDANVNAVRKDLRRHTSGFHTMLITKGDTKDESDIS